MANISGLSDFPHSVIPSRQNLNLVTFLLLFHVSVPLKGINYDSMCVVESIVFIQHRRGHRA